jgi:hypothetical protein
LYKAFARRYRHEKIFQFEQNVASRVALSIGESWKSI